MIHKYKYLFDRGLDDAESVQDSNINTPECSNTPLWSLHAPLFIGPHSAALNTHIHTAKLTHRLHVEVVMHREIAALQPQFIELVFVLSRFTEKQILYSRGQLEPDLYGCWKSLHKGQSLKVTSGEVCRMEKCGQPLLLSLRWPCVI